MKKFQQQLINEELQNSGPQQPISSEDQETSLNLETNEETMKTIDDIEDPTLKLHIFGFLDRTTLCKCAQVSKNWKENAEHREMWKRELGQVSDYICKDEENPKEVCKLISQFKKDPSFLRAKLGLESPRERDRKEIFLAIRATIATKGLWAILSDKEKEELAERWYGCLHGKDRFFEFTPSMAEELRILESGSWPTVKRANKPSRLKRNIAFEGRERR